eukprot:scaffold136078_cov22-Tisochrysis_lutea.AAC.1
MGNAKCRGRGRGGGRPKTKIRENSLIWAFIENLTKTVPKTVPVPGGGSNSNTLTNYVASSSSRLMVVASLSGARAWRVEKS